MAKCLWLLVMCAVAARAATAQLGDIARISNGKLHVGLDARNGALVELIDVGSGSNLVGKADAGLWEIELAGGRKLLPRDAESFRWEHPSGEPATVLMTWGQFKAMPEMRVEVRVRLDQNEPISRWRIGLPGVDGSALRKVHFPRVMKLARSEQESLAVPVWMGQITTKPRELLAGENGKGRRFEWAYPGILSMQCTAFYGAGGLGLYAACDDTEAYRKTIAWFGDGEGGVNCEFVQLPEAVEGAREWTQPYEVLLGVFHGDWVTVAERYRSWGTNQPWAKESRLMQRKVPHWVLDTGLWVWNRGRSEEVLQPATTLQKELGLPVSVFWHWWHGCAYDAGFPEYLPPREGQESFQKAVAAAKKRDVNALVYMNQRLWGMTTRSWKEQGAERFAVKGMDGRVQPENYNTFMQTPCASMCMGTEFWRKTYADLAVRAVRDLGAGGIYMDQACTSLACYDPSHGHPIGGGTYWVRGFQTMAQDIRSILAQQRRTAPPALAGEGCGESWLPHLDLMLSLQVSKERYSAPDGWEPIPFFHAVYHAYGIIYGNYSSLTMPPYDELWPAESAPKEPLQLLDRKFSRQFYLEQARAFVWGQQPTVANFLPEHLQARPEETAYVLRLATLRSKAEPFLQRGTFLRAPDLHVPSKTLDMSRLSIYAGQQGGLKSFQQDYPLALAGAWKAPNREVAFALTSIADEPLEVELEINLAYYGLPEGRKIYQVDERSRRQVGVLTGTKALLKLRLPARGACLLECGKSR